MNEKPHERSIHRSRILDLAVGPALSHTRKAACPTGSETIHDFSLGRSDTAGRAASRKGGFLNSANHVPGQRH